MKTKQKTKTTDAKIDELAGMVAQGFLEMHREFKEEIGGLRAEVKADMKFLRGDIDIMLAML